MPAEILKARSPPKSVKGVRKMLMDSGGISLGVLVAALGVGGALFMLPFVARVPILGGLISNAFSFFRPGSIGDGFSQ